MMRYRQPLCHNFPNHRRLECSRVASSQAPRAIGPAKPPSAPPSHLHLGYEFRGTTCRCAKARRLIHGNPSSGNVAMDKPSTV